MEWSSKVQRVPLPISIDQSYVRSPLSIDWSTRAVLYCCQHISANAVTCCVFTKHVHAPSSVLHNRAQCKVLWHSLRFSRVNAFKRSDDQVCLLCVISPQSVTEVPGMPALYNGREMTLHCDVIALGWQRQVRVFNNKTYFQIIFIGILMNFVWILHWLFD